jgi:hypothetical protein
MVSNRGGKQMKFYCDYCSNQKTETVFPNLLKTNQATIMESIMVCNNHKQNAIAKLVKQKMYKEASK